MGNLFSVFFWNSLGVLSKVVVFRGFFVQFFEDFIDNFLNSFVTFSSFLGTFFFFFYKNSLAVFVWSFCTLLSPSLSPCFEKLTVASLVCGLLRWACRRPRFLCSLVLYFAHGNFSQRLFTREMNFIYTLVPILSFYFYAVYPALQCFLYMPTTHRYI